MVELRPLRITRLAALAPGALVLAFGLGVGFADGGSWRTGGVAAVAGAALAVRGYRSRVTITDRDVVIHGPFRNRSIPRDSVAGYTDWPAVVWLSDLPGPQRSRMVAFRTGSWAPPAVREHNAECVAVLRRTVPPRPGR